jgi:hypothetical protein
MYESRILATSVILVLEIYQEFVDFSKNYKQKMREILKKWLVQLSAGTNLSCMHFFKNFHGEGSLCGSKKSILLFRSIYLLENAANHFFSFCFWIK